MPKKEKLLEVDEILKVLRISRPTLYRWIDMGLPREHLSFNSHGYRLSSVLTWMKGQGGRFETWAKVLETTDAVR